MRKDGVEGENAAGKGGDDGRGGGGGAQAQCQG